ncbi:MAG TPA: Abi family protein [Candidatus Onthousia excrementipullorum]|uniref:Abi family protein n=1 Tax=Candidatus Onthousia excrementipullorum TaxID=2840884 RepID=A0A9D1J2Q6_9FIRM|nr:Abi family protein [Candidatus Onthousia excrementipullorum]
MKEYMSNEQLIDYLISKKVNVINKEEAIKKIEKYTYYSIVNSYKFNFKDSNNNYLPNVSFDEIFALFEFDKNLKYIILKYTLEIETIIKSLMANQISKNYGLINYLTIDNLDDNAQIETKEKLINKINEEINHNYNIHSAITHYKDKYNYIPPFVLMKILTFGVTSRYYGLLKQKDRQKIAKYFKISDKLLKQILKNLTSIRNIAAHSDRLFCFRDKYTLSFKLIDKNYNIKDNTTNLYMMIKALKLILTKGLYNEMIKRINNEIKILDSKLSSISINDILKIMGYPNT